jgi:tetratricopeptide (TPR) repeat protein
MMKPLIKILILLLAVLILILQPLAGQITKGQGKLRGTVKDEQGNPLAGVRVTLHSIRAMSEPLVLQTDKNGQWTAYWIRGGQWNMEFELKGYYPKRDFKVIAEDGTIYQKDVVLKKIEDKKISKEELKKLDRGFELFNFHNYDQALELFNEVLDKSPRLNIVHLYVANCHYQMKNWDKAIEHFQQAGRQQPDNYYIFQSLGNCYFQQGEYIQAIESYKKVLELQPDHLEAVRSIGKSYFNQKDHRKAIHWYEKLDLSLIESPNVAYNIGVFYVNRGTMDKAVIYLKRAVQLKQDFLDALYQLGISYMGLSKNLEARKVFETYLKYDNKSAKSGDVREFIKALKQ